MTTETTLARLRQLEDLQLLSAYRHELSSYAAVTSDTNPLTHFWKTECLYIPLLSQRPLFNERFQPVETNRQEAENLLMQNNVTGVLKYHIMRTAALTHQQIRKPLALQVLYYVKTPLLFIEIEGADKPINHYLLEINRIRNNAPEMTAEQQLIKEILYLNPAMIDRNSGIKVAERKPLEYRIMLTLQALSAPQSWEMHRVEINEIDMNTARANISFFQEQAKNPEII